MAETTGNARLEAFSDGVFATALTLLIIDVRLPSMEAIGSSAELWRALQHTAPAVFAFVLSFVVILITWVNHHGTLKLVRGSTAPFMYANGFLLFTVVFIPFPTALLSAFVWTGHAAPAVVLYDAVLAVQAVGWILLTGTALTGGLITDARASAALKEQRRKGWYGLAFYALLALAALWMPITVAAVTTGSWIVWLTMGIRMKHA